MAAILGSNSPSVPTSSVFMYASKILADIVLIHQGGKWQLSPYYHSSHHWVTSVAQESLPCVPHVKCMSNCMQWDTSTVADGSRFLSFSLLLTYMTVSSSSFKSLTFRLSFGIEDRSFGDWVKGWPWLQWVTALIIYNLALITVIGIASTWGDYD